MDKPDKIFAVYVEGSESRDELPEVFAALESEGLKALSKCYESPAAPYLLATPERELASELVVALREVVAVADEQGSGRCYSDSQVGWEMAMDDVAKLARSVLTKLEEDV